MPGALGLKRWTQFSSVHPVNPPQPTIKSIELATSAEWDELWLKCSHATYFQSREWAEIWEVSSGGRFKCTPFFLRFSDGKQAILAASTVQICGGLLPHLVSSPGGNFGGLIAAEELSGEHVGAVLGHLRRACAGVHWVLNPYDKATPCVSVRTVPDVTHALDLRCGFDAVYKGISKGHRSAARKAARLGVTICEAESVEDWNAYCSVYETSTARRGSQATSRYKRSFFIELAARHSPQIKLLLARYQGEVIAGAVFLHSRNHVAYWHGAALADRFELRGVNLLVETAIRDCCARGRDWFDFNPSGGHRGSQAFKEHFGAQALPCPVISLRSQWLRYYQAAAKLGHALPLAAPKILAHLDKLAPRARKISP